MMAFGILLGCILVGLGFACLLWRTSMIGVLISLQLLWVGCVVLVAFIGAQGQQVSEAQLFGAVALSSAWIQVVGGSALMVRMFWINRRTLLEGISKLKH